MGDRPHIPPFIQGATAPHAVTDAAGSRNTHFNTIFNGKQVFIVNDQLLQHLCAPCPPISDRSKPLSLGVPKYNQQALRRLRLSDGLGKCRKELRIHIGLIFPLNIDLQSKLQVERLDFSFVISFKRKSIPRRRSYHKHYCSYPIGHRCARVTGDNPKFCGGRIYAAIIYRMSSSRILYLQKYHQLTHTVISLNALAILPKGTCCLFRSFKRYCCSGTTAATICSAWGRRCFLIYNILTVPRHAS